MFMPEQKKRSCHAVIMLILLTASVSNIYPDEKYSRIGIGEFGISFLAPESFSRTESATSYRCVIVMNGPGSARITIYTALRDDEETRRWASFKEWYFKDRPRPVRSILGVREANVFSGQKGDIHIYESGRGKNRLISRLMIITGDRHVTSVECTAPTKGFYQNTEIFNTVMASIIPEGIQRNKNQGLDEDLH